MIVKHGSRFKVTSKKGKNLGEAETKASANKRLGEVEYFKHLNKKCFVDPNLVKSGHYVEVPLKKAYSNMTAPSTFGSEAARWPKPHNAGGGLPNPNTSSAAEYLSSDMNKPGIAMPPKGSTSKVKANTEEVDTNTQTASDNIEGTGRKAFPSAVKSFYLRTKRGILSLMKSEDTTSTGDSQEDAIRRKIILKKRVQKEKEVEKSQIKSELPKKPKTLGDLDEERARKEKEWFMSGRQQERKYAPALFNTKTTKKSEMPETAVAPKKIATNSPAGLLVQKIKEHMAKKDKKEQEDSEKSVMIKGNKDVAINPQPDQSKRFLGDAEHMEIHGKPGDENKFYNRNSADVAGQKKQIQMFERVGLRNKKKKVSTLDELSRDTKTLHQFTRSSRPNPIEGGIGDDLNPNDVDQDELDAGIQVEQEHVKEADNKDDEEKHNEGQDIALDHLKEDPNYYTHLQEMERKAKQQEKDKTTGKKYLKLSKGRIVITKPLYRNNPTQEENFRSNRPFAGNEKTRKKKSDAADAERALEEIAKKSVILSDSPKFQGQNIWKDDNRTDGRQAKDILVEKKKKAKIGKPKSRTEDYPLGFPGSSFPDGVIR